MSDNSDKIENLEQEQIEEVDPSEQYSPDSPRFDDDLEGDGIPVIEDEDYDNDLQEELLENDDIVIQNEKDKLLEFNTEFNTDDLILIIFLDKNRYEEYLGVITDITDDYITLNDERNIYYSEGYIQLLHKDYTIIDITKLREVSFDILESDNIFKEDKIELELVEKSKKEKIFTDTEKKEDFISNIISLYNIYDNERLIKNVTETAYLFIELIEQSKLLSEIDDRDYMKFIKDLVKTNKLNIPSSIIPIIGMKKVLFDNDLTDTDDTIVRIFEENFINRYDILNATDDFSSKGYINYMNNLFSDEFESYLNNPNKHGISLNHSGLTIRDCLDDMNPCNSLSGRYVIDLQKIRNALEIIHNIEKEIIVEQRIINIIGFLFIPIDNINEVITLNFENELYNLNDIIQLNKSKNLKNILINSTINNNEINNESTKQKYFQEFNRYSFKSDKQLSYDEFKEILMRNFPTNSEIIDSLNIAINDSSDIYLTNLFYNYDDVEKILNLLGISINDIKFDKKHSLSDIIKSNIEQYELEYKKLFKKFIKPIKPIKTINKELDTKEKIKLCQELIFSQTDLIYQYSLLSKFISIYGREATGSEDKSFYYNKTVDSEKLICKHYLYLIKGDKNSFDVMKSIYGEPSKDGNIYCKKCSRFICYDEFSTFEGFHEGKPSSSKEISNDIEDNLDLSKKNVKDSYDFIKYISEKFNINLQNDDMIKIINLYLLLNHKDLYDIRYENDILNKHPVIKDKTKIDDLKEFLHYINNILSAIFLIFIQIQISNNSYNINFNNRINLINSNESWKIFSMSDKEECINMKVVTYIEAKLKSLVKKYPKERIFNFVGDLFNEFDLYKEMKMSFKRHFLNVIRYWLNPKYSLHTQLDKYFLFESGINKDYIRNSWITYKPLSDNKLVKNIDEFVQSNNELYKKYFVNNNSLQNISLLISINNDEPKYKELGIKLSELMNNSSFKRLFTYALKGYGKIHVSPILNLLTTQFLNTFTKSHKKELIPLLNKCNFNHERNEYSSIIFNIKSPNSFKTIFLRNIIDLDLKKDSDNILKFIHINNYNQEYLLLNSNVDRYYSYTPPNVYITANYDQLLEKNAPILQKLFTYYCLNKNDELIPNKIKIINGEEINTNIINYFLLDFNEELISNISECVKEIPKTQEYFHLIINYLIHKNKMKLPIVFIPYTENYSNIYIKNNIDVNSLIETRLLDFFSDYLNENDTNYDKFNNIIDLIELIIYKKDNGEIINKSEISEQFDIILSSIVSEKNILKNIDLLFNKLIQNDMYLQFNELQKERFSLKLNRKEKTSLERSLGFVPETNILFYLNSILNKLDNKIINDKMINDIFYYLSFLKNTNNGNFNPVIKKKKTWKMSESKLEYISDYLSINTFLLHNEIFLRNKIQDFDKGIKYSGFNQYRKDNYYIFFNELYNHINKYRDNIYKLKTNNNIFKVSQLTIFNKFIFTFIINKISEYINSLLDDKSTEYNSMKVICDNVSDADITVEKSVIILSRFLLDILVNTYDKLYDTNWIYIDKETYKNKLDEHNAREKQFNLDKLDHMTDDKRRLYVANQQIKSGITYKESEKENLKRFIEGERDQQIMDEREEQKKSLFEETMNSGDILSDNLLQNEEQDNIDPDADEGYYDQADFVADGEENEDDLDNLQLYED